MTTELTRRQKYKKSYEKYKKKYKKENPDKLKKSVAKWSNNFRYGGMRDIIFERDNWTCQDCGMTQEQHMALFGRGLTIDHIDGKGRYSKIKNNDLENLVTLCLRCHGRKDVKRRKWRPVTF